MPRKWSNILAYTCWGIAGALALFNLILMIVMLTAGDSRDFNYSDFQGGSAVIVFRSFVDIIWQSGIFGVAGAILFSLRRAG